jgi:addiction module HigA family antidote
MTAAENACVMNYGKINNKENQQMAHMYNPPHPRLTLRDDVLPALGLSVTEAAQQLDVARVTLSRVLNGRAAISPEMALRIEAWLGVERGGEARLWLAEQSAYDLWQVRKAGVPKVKRAELMAA